MDTYLTKYKDLLHFPFDGDEKIKQNYSQAYQDMFVLAALNGKRDGYFLEIGSFDPVVLSNTLLLEQTFGWGGVSVDHSESAMDKMRAYPRKCFLSLNDAVTLDYDALLDSLNVGDRIDYLSLDVEPNVNTFETLKKILLMSRRYSIITFETDAYAGNINGNSEEVRWESRKVLPVYGYEMVAGNISAFSDDGHPFEDWYMDTKFFSPEEIKRFKRESDDPIAAYKYIYNTDNPRFELAYNDFMRERILDIAEKETSKGDKKND
jgi:hypothetical protein